MNQTRDIPRPSEALRLAQQSQALSQRVTPDDRLGSFSCHAPIVPALILSSIGLPPPGSL